MEILIRDNYKCEIDEEDYDLISKYNWNISNGYAKANGKIFMHRLINKTPIGLYTDHIDKNKLNNKKNNLRTCTIQENNCNTKFKNNKTGVKGVSISGNKFRVRIQFANKHISIGSYNSLEDAKLAYINASQIYHKDFGNW